MARIQALVADRRAGFVGQLGRHAREEADGQVDVAAQQHRPRFARGQRHHADVHARRFFFDRAHQRGQPVGGGGVGHRHAEGGLRLRHVEGFRHHRRFQRGQRLAHGRPQRFGARRRLDAVGGTDQQLVAQAFAQAFDGVRYGRLGHGEMAGGAGQVLLGHDGVEDAEQVQVKRQEAHGTPFRQAGVLYWSECKVYPISFTINIRLSGNVIRFICCVAL
jgi:hypothetical protein